MDAPLYGSTLSRYRNDADRTQRTGAPSDTVSQATHPPVAPVHDATRCPRGTRRNRLAEANRHRADVVRAVTTAGAA